jgi:acyl-CoA synthetase (AMP-forming)/AMP-acid ligase II
MNAQGYVTIVDRLRDMIITGGQNVFSAEVEVAVMAHARNRPMACSWRKSCRHTVDCGKITALDKAVAVLDGGQGLAPGPRSTLS